MLLSIKNTALLNICQILPQWDTECFIRTHRTSRAANRGSSINHVILFNILLLILGSRRVVLISPPIHVPVCLCLYSLSLHRTGRQPAYQVILHKDEEYNHRYQA